MTEGFRRNVEQPLKEGYKKIGTLYQEMAALGIRNTEDVEGFLIAAGEALIDESFVLEEHLTKSPQDGRIIEWQVSDAFYAIIQLSITQEQAAVRRKYAPDHTLATDESKAKAQQIKQLSREFYRVTFDETNQEWRQKALRNPRDPLNAIGRAYCDTLSTLRGNSNPESQIQILESAIQDMRVLVDQIRAEYQ